MASRSLTETSRLAWEIASKTAVYEDYLLKNGMPTPSHGLETPASLKLPPSILEARDAAIEASTELQFLLRGPMGSIHAQTYQTSNIMFLHAIYKFNLASCVPLGGEASYEQISEASGLHVSEARRIVRYAITKHIFMEPREGHVAHTATSKMLLENPIMTEWIGMVCEELLPAAARTVEALLKWPGSEERNQTGFSLANETDEDAFSVLSKSPNRSTRFATALSFFNNHPGHAQHYLVDALDWSNVETFVDVGGSLGASAITVAQHIPSVKCIIQDRPEIISRANAAIPDSLTDRVTIMGHNFFDEQPIKNADIYHFRRVFHNWSDKYCIKILQALVPALKPGARVIVSDLVIPRRGSVSLDRERQIREFDLGMMQLFNSKEREESEWATLVKAADERFYLKGIQQPKGSNMSFMEIGWIQSNSPIDESFDSRITNVSNGVLEEADGVPNGSNGVLEEVKGAPNGTNAILEEVHEVPNGTNGAFGGTGDNLTL